MSPAALSVGFHPIFTCASDAPVAFQHSKTDSLFFLVAWCPQALCFQAFNVLFAMDAQIMQWMPDLLHLTDTL